MDVTLRFTIWMGTYYEPANGEGGRLMVQRHTLARKLVSDALDRFAAPEHEVHEGDAQLIVLGAILEVVENGRRSDGVIVITVSKKVGAAISAIAATAAAAVGYLKGIQ